MFISEKNKKTSLKEFILYIGITAFIILFSFVYESCSHGVMSNAMIFAFLYPLLMGVSVYAALYFIPFKYVPSYLTSSIYNLGVALFTSRSIFIGVLEIYGKTNSKMLLTYTILAIVVYTAGVILMAYSLIKGNLKKEEAKA